MNEAMFKVKDGKRIKLKRPAFLLALFLMSESVAVRCKSFFIVFFILGLIILYVSIKYDSGLLPYAALILAFVVLFRGYAVYLKPSAFSDYNNKTVTLTAQLVSYPEYKDSDNVSVVFRCLNGDFDKEKVLVNIESPPDEFDIGGIYEITGTLKVAEGASNPGGFDYKTYLSTKNIKAYINTEASNPVYLADGNLPLFYDDILQIRSFLDNIIRDNLGLEKAGLLSGVLFGESFMDGEVMTNFRVVGAAHVLAVSGLHVGIIYAFAVFLLRRAGVGKRCTFISVLIILAFYCALTGFCASVMRASVMFALMSFSKVTARRGDSFNNLCVAAVLLLVYNPMTLFSVSFQMSFCAAASIVLFVPFVNAKMKPCKNKIFSYIRSLTLLSLVVQISLMPVSVYYFNNINLITVFANLLIIPVISVAVIGGLVITLSAALFPFAAHFLFLFMNIVLEYLIKVTKILADIEPAYLYLRSPRIMEIIFAYFLLFACFGYYRLKISKRRKSWFCFAALCLFLFCLTPYLPPFKTTVHFIDVGFGDCCIIRTKHGENIIIDGGGYLSSDTAKYDIIPFLEYYKIYSLDAAVVTHSHSDHINGIIGLVNYGVKIKKIYANNDGPELYDELITSAEIEGIEVEELYRGDALRYGEVYINVMQPYPEMIGDVSLNDSSIVLSVLADEVDFLLLGDVENIGLRTLLRNFSLSYIDVIKANHHGEYNEYTSWLYEHASPDVCVISVGNNGYSLPNDKLFDVLESSGTVWYTTEDSGCVTFSINGERYEVKEYLSK